MSEDLHKIDDLFKKALDEHSEAPSGSVWENIDKNLDKKSVISISKKYNKLRWIAAALLIFSTGMAMYTWQTKMHNKELVKNIGNNRKENRKGQLKKISNKNETTVLNQPEKSSVRKDTVSISEPNTASRFQKGNEVFTQNEKKSLTEDKKSNSQIPAEEYSRGLVKNDKKGKVNNEKTRLRAEEPLVKYEGASAERQIDSSFLKNNRPNSSVQEQKNNLANHSDITEENSYKEIVLETELQKRDFAIEQANALLQRVLPTLQANNRIITHEKAVFAVKYFKAKNPEKKSLSVTVFFSPDFVSSKINNNLHSFREDDRHEIKKNEKIKSAYTNGFLIDYKTSKTFTVETGLTFSSMTTNIQPKKIYARPDSRGNINFRFNCSAGYSYISNKPGSSLDVGDSISAFSSKNILEYISLPFFVKYNITKGRFSLNPGLGVALNFLTKGKIETAIPGLGGPEKANINHIEGLRQTYLNGSLSLGVNYNLNQTLALSFTPATRFALTSINKDAPFKTYLNSTGLAAGLTIKL